MGMIGCVSGGLRPDFASNRHKSTPDKFASRSHRFLSNEKAVCFCRTRPGPLRPGLGENQMLPRRFEAVGLSVLIGWAVLAVGHRASAPRRILRLGPDVVAASRDLDDVGTGALLFKTKEEGKYIEAPTVAADVKMDVSGPVIRSKVTQRFTNPSKKWVEAVYVFPLPEDSGVDTLKIIVGDRFIEGKIKERAEAAQIYEQAKREGKKAGLMEQERPNMFTTSVANIGPENPSRCRSNIRTPPR